MVGNVEKAFSDVVPLKHVQSTVKERSTVTSQIFKDHSEILLDQEKLEKSGHLWPLMTNFRRTFQFKITLFFLFNKMTFRNSSFPLECSKAKKCKIQTKIESWISHLSPNRNWLYYSPLVTTSGKLISRTVVGGQKNRPDKPQPPNTYTRYR